MYSTISCQNFRNHWSLKLFVIILYIYKVVTNMKSKGLGEFEELILLAVCILGENAYGISVKNEVEKHSQRTVLLGAVHITLYRLQDKGLLESEMGGNTAKRGDRRKRLFKITETGMTQLKASQDVRQKMWQLIPQMNTKLS